MLCWSSEWCTTRDTVWIFPYSFCLVQTSYKTWCPPCFLTDEYLYPNILLHRLHALPFIFCTSSEKGAKAQRCMKFYISLSFMKLAVLMCITSSSWSDQVHVTLTSGVWKLPHLNVCQLCSLISEEILKKI